MACTNPAKFFPVSKGLALAKDAFKGKVALVTGGGTGMGKAMARVISMLGGDVAIASRKIDVLQKAAKEIENESGRTVLPIKIDVRDLGMVKNCIDTIEEKFGKTPNVVINNAAGNFICPFERLSNNAFKTVVDIVLNGSFNVTHEVGKRVIKNQNDGCSFLYLSANYARNTAEFLAHSGVAKAGVESMARTLTGEWGKYGMRFNIICPGPIPTKGGFGNLSPDEIEKSIELVNKSIPAGRCGDVHEIANLAAFVVSDYATYISGATIDIDGGKQYLFGNSGVGPYYHSYTNETLFKALMQSTKDTNFFLSTSSLQHPCIFNFSGITNNQEVNSSCQLPTNKHQYTKMEFTCPIPTKKTNFDLKERNLNTSDSFSDQKSVDIKQERVEQFNNYGRSWNTMCNVNDKQDFGDNCKCPEVYNYNQQPATDNHNNELKSPNSYTSISQSTLKKQLSSRRRQHPYHISTVRARKETMTIDELQQCLDKKLEEKLLHKVPATLIDKTHAKCGICQGIISLNKKFEIIHVVRHFLAWHKTNHICTRTWPGLEGYLSNESNIYFKNVTDCPQKCQFFSRYNVSFVSKNRSKVVTKKINARNKDKKLLYGPKESYFNVKCELCCKMMEHRDVSTHFHSFHSEVINTPKCNLCTQEVLINAELEFLYEKNYQLSIIDEGNLKSIALNESFNGIDELYKRLDSISADDIMPSNNNCSGINENSGQLDNCEMLKVECSNSSRSLGKNLKPKRTFVHPRYRQAIPKNSLYVEEIETNHWRCKLCNKAIIGAVISSAATKHFKNEHFNDSTYLDKNTMKSRYNPESIFYKFCMELCNARLNRCSGGHVRMLDEKTIACEQCNGYVMTLHREFNICRGIRHLKLKHPELMPEYNEFAFQEGNTSNGGNSNVVNKHEEILVENNVIPVSSYQPDPSIYFPSHNIQATEYYYFDRNPVPPVRYVYDVRSENVPLDYTIENNANYYNYILPDYVNIPNSSSYFHQPFYMNNYNNYPSYTTTMPLQESTPTLEIPIEDGSEEFYTRVSYENYPIQLETIDTILKTNDIDGRDCYILMTEEDKFDHEAASKIYFKNYTQI